MDRQEEKVCHPANTIDITNCQTSKFSSITKFIGWQMGDLVSSYDKLGSWGELLGHKNNVFHKIVGYILHMIIVNCRISLG